MADSGERNLKPTARRIQQARERGQVPRTRELGPALAFLAVAAAAAMAGARPWTEPFQLIRSALERAGQSDLDPDAALRLMAMIGTTWVPAVVVLLGAALGGAVVAQVLQGGPHPASEALKLDPSRLSPATKLKSLFSLKHLWETARALAAGAVALWIIASELRGLAPELPALSFVASTAIGGRLGELLIGVAWRAGLGLALIGALDLLMSHLLYVHELRMSREDVKQETRAQEGRPEVRMQRRRRMLELVRARSVTSVRLADVVVTNPTHYAVALSYRRGLMRAPRVIAKGRNRMAHRIRVEALRHGVPLVENPALARELYRKVPVEGEVPPELYLAVAEVIAFVMRLDSSLNLGEPVEAG